MEIWNRRNPVGGAPIVDSALDVNSEHCVQNKVVAEAISTINSKLSQLKTTVLLNNSTTKLTAGTEFTLSDSYENYDFFVISGGRPGRRFSTVLTIDDIFELRVMGNYELVTGAFYSTSYNYGIGLGFSGNNKIVIREINVTGWSDVDMTYLKVVGYKTNANQ